MCNAGWIATTMNYLWVIVLGLFACTLVCKVFNDETIGKLYYLLVLLSSIYAANQEQMCAIMLVVFFVCTIYAIVNKKRWKTLIPIDIICILELLYIIFLPGEKMRSVREISNWYPDFRMLSIFDKFILGIARLFNEVYFSFNFLFFVLLIILIIMIFKKYSSVFVRLLSMYPMMIYLLSTVLRNNNSEIAQYFSSCDLIKISTYSSIESYISWALYLTATICVIQMCFLVVDKKEELINVIVLGLGAASVVVMGFSPTLYASDNRIFSFWYFSLIVVDLMYMKKLAISRIKNRFFDAVDYFAILICLCIAVNTIMILINM